MFFDESQISQSPAEEQVEKPKKKVAKKLKPRKIATPKKLKSHRKTIETAPTTAETEDNLVETEDTNLQVPIPEEQARADQAALEKARKELALALGNKPEEVETAEGQEVTLETLKNRENKFAEREAKQVVTIIKDWIKHGGELYDHLTGKDPRLESGETLEDKVDTWLQSPENAAWLNAGKDFNERHKKEICGGRETEDIRRETPDGEENYTRMGLPKGKHFLRMNGFWLQYNSNMAENNKESQPDQERISERYGDPTTRVYFDVKGDKVFEVFEGLIDLLNQDPVLKEKGFRAKTPDVGNLTKKETGAIMNQKDKIIFYFGPEGIKAALPIIQKYAEQNHSTFGEREGVLFAQPMIDGKGEELPGIGVTAERIGTSPNGGYRDAYNSFNGMENLVLLSCFKTIMERSWDSNTPRTEWSGLSAETLKKLAATKDPFKDGDSNHLNDTHFKSAMQIILEDKNGQNFLEERLPELFNSWSEKFGMSKKNIAFAEK